MKRSSGVAVGLGVAAASQRRSMEPTSADLASVSRDDLDSLEILELRAVLEEGAARMLPDDLLQSLESIGDVFGLAGALAGQRSQEQRPA